MTVLLCAKIVDMPDPMIESTRAKCAACDADVWLAVMAAYLVRRDNLRTFCVECGMTSGRAYLRAD